MGDALLLLRYRSCGLRYCALSPCGRGQLGAFNGEGWVRGTANEEPSPIFAVDALRSPSPARGEWAARSAGISWNTVRLIDLRDAGLGDDVAILGDLGV